MQSTVAGNCSTIHTENTKKTCDLDREIQ